VGVGSSCAEEKKKRTQARQGGMNRAGQDEEKKLSHRRTEKSMSQLHPF